MQRPQLACCLPVPGVSRLLGGISASPLCWGSPLTLCFEAVMNPEAVLTDLPVPGLLLLCWILWRQDTAEWEQIYSTAMWSSSFFSSQQKLDLCWVYLTSWQKSWALYYYDSFLSQWLHQSGDQYSQAYPFCSCPLHNISLLLLFPARILHQLSEMDMQPLYCAKPPRKNSF